MPTTDIPHEVRHTGWDHLVLDHLSRYTGTHSHELIWAIDGDKKIIMANEAYKQFIYRLTGRHLCLDVPALADVTDTGMADRWDLLYTRALTGQQFHVITNYCCGTVPVMIDAHFIPLHDRNEVVGSACIARRSHIFFDSHQLMSIDIPGQ